MITDAQVQQLKAMTATLDADETSLDGVVAQQVQTAAALVSAQTADTQAQTDVATAQTLVQTDVQSLKDFINAL